MTRFRRTVSVSALAFLALFLFYPLLMILQATVQDEAGRLTFAPYVETLSARYYLGSFANSLTAASLSMLFASALAVPLAFCIARIAVPGKTVLLALAALPLVLPSFVGAYALVLLFGHAGLVTTTLRQVGIAAPEVYGTGGIVLVFTLTLYPYVLMPVLAGLQKIDMAVEESARNLGGSRLFVFRTVLLPLLGPAILAGALLVFIEALENFGVPAVLAEDRPFLALDIFKLFAGEAESNPAAAGVLSILLVGCALAALLVQRGLMGRQRFATGTRGAPRLIPLHRLGRIAAGTFCWGVVLLSLLPFAAVAVISLQQFRGPVMSWRLGFGNYAALLAGSYRPLTNTVALATIAALAAVVLGAPVGYVLARQRSPLTAALDGAAVIPFAVSGTVLGIGMVMAFNAGWLVLTGGWLILVLAYLVRKLPFTVRGASAIVQQLDPSIEEASVGLGVPPVRTFAFLTVPLMAQGLLGTLVLVWVTVASELSSTIVLYSSQWRTMTVLMYQALEGTAPGEAAAAATVLIVATGLPLLLAWRLLRRNEAPLL